MVYNDEQLASIDQMEQMARAYKDYLTKSQAACCPSNFDTLSHLFNEAGCLAGKLLSKASGKKSKQTFNGIYNSLLNGAKTFYTHFDKSPKEEVINYPKNFMKSAKQLIYCHLEIITNLIPLSNIPKFESLISELITNIKSLIELA